MKATTDRAELAEALAWVTRVIGPRPVAAVLGGVRVTATEDGLNVRAFDFETSHQAALAADVSTEGECLVPGLFLRDAVAGGRGKEVELVLEDGVLTVTSGRSTYRVRTLKLEDYPSLPEFPDVVGSIKADVLADAVRCVLAAADHDRPHDNIRGLRIEAEERLALVGTDGFRFHSIEVDWEGKPFAATVPAKTFAAAVKGMAGTVEIGHTEGLIGLSDGHRTVTTRLYDSKYGDWRKVLSTQAERATEVLTVDGADLLAAVKQVGSVTAPEHPVVLEYADGELLVTTGAQEAGEGSEVVAATGDGTLRVGLDHRYLADVLAATSGGLVEIRYGTNAQTIPIMVADPAAPHLDLLLMSKRIPGEGPR